MSHRFHWLIVAIAICFFALPAARADDPVRVRLQTSSGDIVIELNEEKAPVTVANFLSYVDNGFYDGTIFHRVVPQFVIQGGGFTTEMEQKKTEPPIKNESFNGLSNKRGTIAMARTSAPDSATSQFYINLRDNSALDGDKATSKPGYTVFGTVVEGIEVVDKIAKVQTSKQGLHENVPNEAVIIIKAERVGGRPAPAPGEKGGTSNGNDGQGADDGAKGTEKKDGAGDGAKEGAGSDGGAES